MSLLRTFSSIRFAHRRKLSSASASITKIHRNSYLLQYPTLVILPDGSSVTVRYSEPRQIIKLPLDLSTLTEEEIRARLEKRRPLKKVEMKEEQLPSFNSSKYLNLIKKKH